MYGKYIYGVIVGGGEAILGVRELAGTGLVHAITHEGLSCVVSDYNGEDFCNMSQKERAQCLMAHQAVVGQIAKKHPILPVKSGTVLADPGEVGEMLAQGHPQFSLTLLWITMGCSAAFAVNMLPLRIVLIVIAIGVTIHILYIRTSRDKESG